ncbi:hypothetical protein SESBI_50040 [Sesbania bispinosa]|nr:hypothetical protein SESBI_50040 [Sesbania bispinosa]
MALSLHHGKRVILDQVGRFADGVAVKNQHSCPKTNWSMVVKKLRKGRPRAKVIL